MGGFIQSVPGTVEDGINGDNPERQQDTKLESSESVRAKKRWKYLKHSVNFASKVSQHRFAPATSADLLDESAAIPQVLEDGEVDKGETGAEANGPKTGDQKKNLHVKQKGRLGLEGLQVRQVKSALSFIADFYVLCLRMPILHFLVGMFAAPLLLGVLFTPFYLLDIEGLDFGKGAIGPEDDPDLLKTALSKCHIVVNVLLYAVSLSTTFGGSPVELKSPYTLLLANLNTLMSQLLFVFLSGAVFARLSQPGHPVRCAKHAILNSDDQMPTSSGWKSNVRTFGTRLVLTGASPCELVNVKICLTFRIFLSLPDGSIFCSTSNLPLVRSEVAYMRYGLTVRHVIDESSPLADHSIESLQEGDASFSLTVVGMERSSMAAVFHIQEYFVHDGDVLWDAEFEDIVTLDSKGFKVFNHKKIDIVKSFKGGAIAVSAISRMSKDVAKKTGNKRTKSIWSAFGVNGITRRLTGMQPKC